MVTRKKTFQAFRGKKVFVTGDTGFKGAWLCFWLHELGAEVTGYALPPQYSEGLYVAACLRKRMHHVDGDIRDLTKLQNVIRKFKPEFLFHLAAQPLVRLSYRDPKTTFDTNVGGSVNVLEAARHTSSLRAVIYVTSDKCYENKEWLWGYRENDALGGHDPYSASKAAAEIVFSSYFNSFFKHSKNVGAASVRAGNVFGGGDWSADRIVPDCIKALRRKKPVVLRNPLAVRPWQHVLDPLYGYLRLAVRLHAKPERFSGSWNFGPSASAHRTVRELAENVAAFWGEGEIIVRSEKNAPCEAGYLHLNCDKAHALLQWRPAWGFHRAVEETVRWYKEVREDKTRATDVTRKQIHRFMEETHD